MPRRREDSRAWPSAGFAERQADSARARLSEAVTELRRLSGNKLRDDLEGLIDFDDLREASGVSVESVRRLRARSAAYLRLAADLEAAARCCRLIEQELRQEIDGLLSDFPGLADPVGNRGADQTARKTHRNTGLAGWLKAISPYSQASHRKPDRTATESDTAPRPRPTVWSERSRPAPFTRPEADVAALMLGPLELEVAGRRVVRWSSLKARTVFEYLLIHNDRPVRRDVLMELQWPNHTPTSARNNLNVALCSLRNTLEGPWRGVQAILYQDGCYVLNPQLTWWMDRDEFLSALSQAQLVRVSDDPRRAICHYQRAVELYRGPLFEDDLNGDWYLAEQRHLGELYLQALESLGEIYFDLGELASAEQSGRLALMSDPCCESVHRLLMQCYASEQKQQLVTRQYRMCVDALREELGVSPGAETRRLFRDLTSAGP